MVAQGVRSVSCKQLSVSSKRSKPLLCRIILLNHQKLELSIERITCKRRLWKVFLTVFWMIQTNQYRAKRKFVLYPLGHNGEFVLFSANRHCREIYIFEIIVSNVNLPCSRWFETESLRKSAVVEAETIGVNWTLFWFLEIPVFVALYNSE